MSSKVSSWLVYRYQPVGIFSLRQTTSTSVGGKSLLIPSPYAIVLAAVDAAYRVGGEEMAEAVFGLIYNSKIRVKPPRRAVVTNTFIKIKDELRNKDSEHYYKPNISFREQVFFQGEMQIAIEFAESADGKEQMDQAFSHINYFGKRGSFFQFIGTQKMEKLDGFIRRSPDELSSLVPEQYGVMQFLDEIGTGKKDDLFNRINSYSTSSLSLGKHRVLTQYVLPYRVQNSSNEFTSYCAPVEEAVQ